MTEDKRAAMNALGKFASVKIATMLYKDFNYAESDVLVGFKIQEEETLCFANAVKSGLYFSLKPNADMSDYNIMLIAPTDVKLCEYLKEFFTAIGDQIKANSTPNTMRN